VWASKTWPFCGACKNVEAEHLLGAEIWFFKKLILWANISRKNAVESGPKFTGFFPSNAKGNALDNLFFLFWISLSVSQIFALKLGKCLKSRQI